MTLVLTAEGRRVELRVARVEEQLYAWLARLTENQPLQPALDVLRAVARDLPAGQALARRT